MGPQQDQTLTFRDGSEQWKSAFAETFDSTRDVTYHEDVSLQQFFERPVKIAAFTWSTADAVDLFSTFDPWASFMSNPRVANRLTNYQNFSANLHVKFVINGNSFLYGRLIAEYFPLRAFDTISDTTSSTYNLMQASQRLHLYIDPCESQAGELTLPFVWFEDKLDLRRGQFTSMGTMYMRTLQRLKHANGATGNVNISVFAWATNVKLSIPTVNDISGLVAQSGTFDEYGKGPVSSVASAVAAASGMLTSIPYIGAYARATQMVASAAAGVAKMFGYSKPPIIGDYMDMRPSFVSRIANVEGGDNVAKLTMDPKQELTIDPRVVGLSGVDELAINTLVKKESYLTQFPWTVAAVGGDLLFSTRVGPPWDYNASNYYLPAVTYASLPFKYWRGSMKYRFQIVASGYHKGRILLVWDPAAQGSAPETNVQYSKIIDLADERDFTFEVGWGNNVAWCEVPTLGTTLPFRTSSVFNIAAPIQYNGVVSVYVLNELTTPNSTVNNDIAINVFVSACDDYKVSTPTGAQIAQLAPTTSAIPQSGTFEEVAVENKNAPRNDDAKEILSMCEPLVDHTDSVYFGESIVSLRQLMKRYSLLGYLGIGTAAASNGAYRIKMPSFPGTRGYTNFGASIATLGEVNPFYTTIINYLSFSYMAYRGGMRWKIVVDDTLENNALITVSRSSILNDYVASWLALVADVVTSAYVYSSSRLAASETYQSGGHLTISRQPVLEFEAPYYQSRRFSSTRNLGAKATYAADDLSQIITSRVVTGSTQSFALFVAGAEDSTFIGFQGAPPLIKLALPAT